MAIYQAALENNLKNLKSAVENNPGTINQEGGSANMLPITAACWKGHEKNVRYLLEQGAYVNLPNTKWKTVPVHMAAAFNEVECLKALLEYSADVNIQSIDGKL